MKNDGLTNILLLQAKEIVERLLRDSRYTENMHELNELKGCIEESLESINNNKGDKKENDVFEKVVKIIDLLIKFLGLKEISDFFSK